MKAARVRILFGIVAIAAIVAANGPSLVPPAATAEGGLFSEPSGQLDTPPAVNRAVVRERRVDVNFPLLDGAARGGAGAPLTLNLFKSEGRLYPDVSLTATGDRTERTSSGQGSIWYGRVPGDPLSQVILVSENGVLAGDIHTNGRIYQIRYTGSGSHVISELNPAAFPPDEDRPPPRGAPSGGVGAARAAVAAAVAGQSQPAQSTSADRAPLADQKGTAGSPAAATPGPALDSSSTIDFMVLYTPAAASEAGGATAMSTQINMAVAAANQAYANSGVTFRARLVFQGQVNYTENSDMGVDLTNLRANAVVNGSGQSAATLRGQFGADIVSLFVKHNASACGIAWLMYTTDPSPANDGFNVVDWTCATSNFSLAHESGHNMGLCHDWIQNDCDSQVIWGHGYVDPQNRFRDIMSYPQSCGGCTRVGFFSNLITTFQGSAIGTAHDQPFPADNVSVLNGNAAIVANYRQCVVATCSAGPVPTRVPAPPNDNFANATTVTGVPAQFTANNTSATVESGEPVNSCVNAPFSVGNSVWYSWTPTTSSTATISTIGSGIDTVLAVYTGSAVNSLTMVTCNDDISGVSNRRSQVTFNAIAGVTYRIQVGGFSEVADTGSGPAVVTTSGSVAVNFSAVPGSPTPAANCSPRPSVSVTTAPASGGRLQVNIVPAATGGARLLNVQIGAATNALVDVPALGSIPAQTLGANQTITLPPETFSLTLFVRHAVGGQATTVPLTVNDGCGSWPTLVGGGGTAF